MPASDIVVKGAREHNLRDVSLVLPRNQLVCLTGVSGSGKSSLAFDTLYAEGQRRYVESLSSFARQFLGQMPKPDVDLISGLSPSISISQKSTGNNPRSTVGTITEIYDYLRVLFARVSTGHCPKCGEAITAQTREQIIEQIMGLDTGTHYSVLAPIIRGQKGEYRDLFEDLLKQGYIRARVDGDVVSLTDDLQLDRQMRHNIEVVIDRLTAKPSVRPRLAEAVDLAMKVGKGNLVVSVEGNNASGTGVSPVRGKRKGSTHRRDAGSTVSDDILFSTAFACIPCGLSFQPPSPQLFSFNSPQGMCPECDGLGQLYTFDPELLIPDPTKSFQQGAVATVGPWKDLGRWRRHIYQGVAETMERKLGLDEGTLLETAWEELDEELQDVLLWGTGEEHITFTWRQGNSPQKYGGTYDGIIPDLLSKYASTNSKMHQRALEKYMSTVRCPDCDGQRLNPQARHARVTSASPLFAERASLTLPQVCGLPVNAAQEFFAGLRLTDTQQIIAAEAIKEIRGRLGFLMNVGLDYLALDRTAPTLSGGESQRIRLAGQIGCGLVGVLYILDEPSIGLHPRDNDRLLATLCQLRDMGNTVLVVEHDEDTMRIADHIIDFGPGPGVRGGEVVAEGDAATVMKAKRSVTGDFLSGKRSIAIPEQRRLPGATGGSPTRAGDASELSVAESTGGRATSATLRIVGATHNNLKNVTVDVPLGAFVCVTGVSGSGKSSLVNDILVEALRRDLNRGDGEPGGHERIEGIEQLDKMISIDQSPIGRTPRSNPGTYIKVFDEIRKLFTQLPDAKRRGYKPGRFSFNVEGGRCEACQGNGSNKLEMDFLADIWVTCPVCEGHRFNRETLGIQFKGKSIAEVLEMDVQEALELFENQPKIAHRLQTLHDVGLDYVKIGQPSPTLSGGEAQRIKLARELAKKGTGKTIYFLDEPTTGLHFADIEMLLKVLHDFVDAGNTVVVVEHNLDVIKTADWVVDLGPEGGEAGGRIVVAGTPEEVAEHPDSHTGKALAEVLSVRSGRIHPAASRPTETRPRKRGHYERIKVQGAQQHNLKHVDVEIPRDAMSVFCGPSGSGKTSLAMDTIYAEGQRRYVESLSAYARQFVGQMQKPKLEHIEGLSPAIAIEQKNLGHTPRSTVGTVTEIYDYFRILFARLGQMHCPDCDCIVGTQTADQIIDKVLAEADGTKLFLMSPVEIEVGRKYESLWDELRAGGYSRVRVDGQTHSLDKPPEIDRRRKHRVEVVVDRVIVRAKERDRIAESIENTLALGRGVLHVAHVNDDLPETRWPVVAHSQHLACEHCGRSFEPLTPHNFSFNSHLGWCGDCEGLGTQVGANPAALIRDGKLSLAEGALALWPDVSRPLSLAMLEALSRETGVPLDVPLDQLNARQRRIVMHGSGEQWIEVPPLPLGEGRGEGSPRKTATKRRKADNSDSPHPNPLPKGEGTAFRFQFKGLYPALEEASRLSPAFRTRLEHIVDEVDCTACGGSRLRDDAAAVQWRGKALDEICRMPLGELREYFKSLKLKKTEKRIAGEVLREINGRLEFLCDVGLEYLTLARSAPTLSAGEAQRIRLASQLGSGLCGVLYVLDEPTIGLHPRDNTRLLKAMHKLRDLGNTLIVVEHDREVIEGCDQVFDFGPAAGKYGGEIVASGDSEQLLKRRKSVTGPYLSGKKAIAVPANRRIKGSGVFFGERGNSTTKKTSADRSSKKTPDPVHPALRIVGARHNNLRNVDATIPLGALTAVTGPSGSGKSSLIEDVLYAALAKRLHRANLTPGAHDEIRGAELINKVIRVDQKPLGNSPASNPATYTGLFELVRQLFAQLPEAKLRGYTQRRFSFNVPGGRCEACEGDGQICIEMHFLPDVWVECENCRGKRYNPETLSVKFHGRSIADVLEMTCGEALVLFANIPKIRRTLQTLCDVGLDYVQLGQPAPTLSGGEAQRVKLAAELARPDTGQTLYLLDEPTTGLHFDDLAKLLEVLHRLVDLGNTVVVIEHNLDVIKQADWIIDMGPEAGDGGGEVVACGTPEEIVNTSSREPTARGVKKTSRGRLKPVTTHGLYSYTAEYLAPVLTAGPHVERKVHDFAAEAEERSGDLDIDEVGENTKMPWQVDGRQWHTVDRVGRRGEVARWDGEILGRVVDRIHELGEFSATNWDSRTVVEISAEKKADGWFFHALTGEAWLLKMKFRVAKNTFKRDELERLIPLPTLNEMDELPIYGNDSRVKCKNLRGPWQEVELRVHSLEEIDTPEFWKLVEEAVAGFFKHTMRVQQKPEDVMPWKVLGQKWHLSRKGFPPGKQAKWPMELLEELFEMLSSTAPKGQFLWNNQVLVHLYANGHQDPWATVVTKKTDAVELRLNGPKGRFALGRISEMGRSRELEISDDRRDTIKLRFRKTDELHQGGFDEFLQEHVESLSE